MQRKHQGFLVGRLCTGVSVATLALLVLSCAQETNSPTSPGSISSVPVPQFAAGTPANGTGQCMGDDAADYGGVDGIAQDGTYSGTGGDKLNCTTNDIFLASAVVTAVFDPEANGGVGGFVAFDPENPPHCSEGGTVTFQMTANLGQNAESDREDVGIWIATDGGNAETGTCNHYNLVDGATGTFNEDGDQCAGMAEASTTSVNLGTLTVACEPNETNTITVGACLSWKVPSVEGEDKVCPDNGDGDLPGDEPTDFRARTLPANKSKCNCEGFDVPIIVDKTATIEVVKACPTGTTGSFDLNIDAPEDPDYFQQADAACGGTTGAQTVGAGDSQNPGAPHSVSESGFTTGDYFSTYSCTVDPAGAEGPSEFASGTGTSVGPFDVNPDDVIVCTFTNEAKTVTVTKTATPSLTRTWFWDIDKVADPTTVTLDPDQVYSHPYSVAVTLDGENPSDDSEWAVTGNITVHNPTSGTVNVATVTDGIAGGFVGTVVCPGDLPQDLASGADLVCTYSADLSTDGGTTRLNTATATLTGVTGSFTGTASIDFANAVVTHEDNCLVVKDEGDLGNTDPLGTVCAPGTTPTPAGAFTAPKTFNYTRLVPTGSAQCGVITYNNTATGTTNTNSTVYTDAASIEVTIECPEGCTLTQGYWKTHNDLFRVGLPGGPASDPAWANVGGPGATFFLSGQTWFQVFWTAPAGNPYYILAHQYMAAVLNDLDGVTPSADVTLAINQAAALFGTYTPAQIAKPKGNPQAGAALRAEFIRLAGILGSFNEGLSGVEHCTEDATSNLIR